MPAVTLSDSVPQIWKGKCSDKLKARKEKRWLFMLGADVSLFRTLASMLSLFHILSACFFTSYKSER